jgi:hypothetical protein
MVYRGEGVAPTKTALRWERRICLMLIHGKQG